MKKKDTLLSRVFILLTIINFNLKAFSQLTNLSEIQNDLSVKKTEFPKHYNFLIKKFINNRDSLITTKELLIKKHSASVDGKLPSFSDNLKSLNLNCFSYEKIKILRSPNRENS
jgi:hypothetical protein